MKASLKPPSQQAPRRIELIVILGALTAFAPLAIDMYLPALPTIAHSFAAPITGAEHTLAAFFLGFALGQAIYGPLADRYGRKPPLYAGILLYTVACAGCAVAGRIEVLVAWRFFQAAGACAAVVIARATVRDLFEGDQVARIFSAMMLILGVAPVLAPLIGGYLLAGLGWRAIFWLQGAIGIAVFAAIFFRLPETHGGARRALHPMAIGRDYFVIASDRRFIGYALAGAGSSAGMFAYITGSPHVFIDLFGVPAEYFGWLFGANALGLIVLSQIVGRVLRTHAAESVLPLAQGAQVLSGLLLLVFALSGFGGLWGIACGLFLFVSLNGAVSPTASGLALKAFGAQAGMASALLGTIQFAAAAIAATLVGSIPAATPVPLAVIVAGFGLFGFLAARLIAPHPR